MEIIALGFLLGVVFSLVVFGAGAIYGNSKGQSDDDSDVRTYVPSWDRSRCGNNRCDTLPEAEEVINGLQDLRMALSRKEKEYLDYACDCVLIRQIMHDRAEKMCKCKEGREKNAS